MLIISYLACFCSVTGIATIWNDLGQVPCFFRMAFVACAYKKGFSCMSREAPIVVHRPTGDIPSIDFFQMVTSYYSTIFQLHTWNYFRGWMMMTSCSHLFKEKCTSCAAPPYIFLAPGCWYHRLFTFPWPGTAFTKHVGFQSSTFVFL